MRLDSLMQDLAIQAQASSQAPSDPTEAFYAHASAARVNTEAYMAKIIREKYPHMSVAVISESTALLPFAAGTGEAKYTAITDQDPLSEPLAMKTYLAPARRIDGPQAARVAERIKYGKYEYTYKGVAYILFVVDSRDGSSYFPATLTQLLVHPPTEKAESTINELTIAIGQWSSELHNEMWVFDQGWWTKNADLWKSIQKSHWRDVILDEDQKLAIQNDVRHFFDSKERYDKLRVPWKRGVIYYGPPGNGKTISIKALSHELYSRKDPVPTLYVKSFAAYGGPQRAVQLIFEKARKEAPCLLVFEDLDSLVTDGVRSYFLNEVDGLSNNEGVMMLGSTNHLDRLDPSISKRPSRFDRKFPFPKPDLDQRTAYCEYWRGKLADSKEIEFPKELSPEIAKITDKFSFAYLQEAFVAALLAIAFDQTTEGSDKPQKRRSWEDLILWKEIQKAVNTLREEI